MYNMFGKDIEEDQMEMVKACTLEARLLHALQLADAIRASPASAEVSEAAKKHVLYAVRPFERIWAAPAVSISELRHGESQENLVPSLAFPPVFVPPTQPYAAKDAIVDKGWFLRTRSWGYTREVMKPDQIAQSYPWLADDELALEAALEAQRRGNPASEAHEELLLERALVALTAAIVASKDHGRLVAAPLRATPLPVAATTQQQHATILEAVRSLNANLGSSDLDSLHPDSMYPASTPVVIDLIPEPERVREGLRVRQEDIQRGTGEGKSFRERFFQSPSLEGKEWKVRAALAEHLQVCRSPAQRIVEPLLHFLPDCPLLNVA